MELDKKAAAIEATAQQRDKRVTAAEREASLTRVNQESTALKQQRQLSRPQKPRATPAHALERKKAARQAKT